MEWRVGRVRRIWDNVTDTMDPKRYAIIAAVGLGVFALHRIVTRNIVEIRQIRRTALSKELQQANPEVQHKVRVATSMRDVKMPLVRGVKEYDLKDTGVINLPSELENCSVQGAAADVQAERRRCWASGSGRTPITGWT